ncbi:MAG: hypothetical protein EXX96DRAFT_543024 [Benjaminiella poitrasii]|nr:MAG: hypothetical protein EXX96DRAFT_543024 [Benjaminiella poitrasii]
MTLLGIFSLSLSLFSSCLCISQTRPTNIRCYQSCFYLIFCRLWCTSFPSNTDKLTTVTKFTFRIGQSNCSLIDINHLLSLPQLFAVSNSLVIRKYKFDTSYLQQCFPHVTITTSSTPSSDIVDFDDFSVSSIISIDSDPPRHANLKFLPYYEDESQIIIYPCLSLNYSSFIFPLALLFILPLALDAA